MLVISRREGESVIIGDVDSPIGSVRVAGVVGGKVRLAFEFPRDVEINRPELAAKKLECPRTASSETA